MRPNVVGVAVAAILVVCDDYLRAIFFDQRGEAGYLRFELGSREGRLGRILAPVSHPRVPIAQQFQVSDL